MYLPAIHDEKTTLVNYLAMQLDALRASAHGLTDDQATARPLKSELTIAGLLKHAVYVMNGALVGAGLRPEQDDTWDQPGSFHLAADETLESVLADFDQAKDEYLAMCREGDLDQVMPIGPFPWYGMDEPRDGTLRYIYVHHVEEFARHAGHADLIREEIDGAQAASLNAAIEGRPANDFVTPWTPSA